MRALLLLSKTLWSVALIALLLYAFSALLGQRLSHLRLASIPSLTKKSSFQIPFSRPSSALGKPQACEDPLLSCQTARENQNTCCFNYPSGLFLQTQFWDAHPATGPVDRWTVHGLWPDHCDGSYDQYCDSSRTYLNISSIITSFGRKDLLLDMMSYWKDYQGNDENLWKHEWNKHGTCISTLETKCYHDYTPQQEVLAYFDKTVELFKSLHSYKVDQPYRSRKSPDMSQFLEAASITPSRQRTYDLDEIHASLRLGHGTGVNVRCRGGYLSEIWYYFNVAGSVQTGVFEPADLDGLKSNCPQHGIMYPPKVQPPLPTSIHLTKTDSRPSPTGAPFTGRGCLDVFAKGRRNGCVISRGTWYTSGTCARFLVAGLPNDTNSMSDSSSKMFTLESSKGPCAFKNDMLTCNSEQEISPAFSSAGGKLSFNGSTTFFADAAPTRWNQEKIHYAERPTTLEIRWRPV